VSETLYGEKNLLKIHTEEIDLKSVSTVSRREWQSHRLQPVLEFSSCGSGLTAIIAIWTTFITFSI
jgi:hypothetical protein